MYSFTFNEGKLYKLDRFDVSSWVMVWFMNRKKMFLVE